MLCNKPTIALSIVCGLKLAHATGHITPWGSWLHWRTPNQTCAQLIFYSIV